MDQSGSLVASSGPNNTLVQSETSTQLLWWNFGQTFMIQPWLGLENVTVWIKSRSGRQWNVPTESDCGRLFGSFVARNDATSFSSTHWWESPLIRIWCDVFGTDVDPGRIRGFAGSLTADITSCRLDRWCSGDLCPRLGLRTFFQNRFH